jgi:hypothetical protein
MEKLPVNHRFMSMTEGTWDTTKEPVGALPVGSVPLKGG